MVVVSGIVGRIFFDGTDVPRASVETMAAAAPHRGADGDLVWVGAGAGLGYQRRRILADGADERGLVEQDGLVCVADIRLDDRDELAAAMGLEQGVVARTGDAVLVLAAYRRWGDACAARLIGDFAFAIWDGPRRRLFAARDPLAMRSLSYHVIPGRSVAFATEIKQILALPDVPVRLNEAAALGDLMGRFGTPAETFYDGIHHLAPGHSLVVDGDGWTTSRFWDADPEHRIWLNDEAEYADLLRQRFTDAVAARLRTDRPAGILLSGGVDSGSVAGAAGWLWQRGAVPAPSIHAFSWAFERFPECDERRVSELIVRHYGFDRTDIPADHGGPLAGFPDHGPDRDDPFLGGFQPVIEHGLSAARDAGVGLMLGGDRGDLVIGSTGWSHLRLAQARRWRDLRMELAEHHRATADGWGGIVRDQFVAGVIGRLRRRSPREWLRRIAGGRARVHEPARPSWLRPSPALAAVEEAAAVPSRPDGFNRSRALRHDMIFTPLHLRGMAWSERTYARHGLGFADPFSDRRLVELVLAIPQVVINRPGDVSKPLMRAAMRGLVPEDARLRLDKVVPTPLFEQTLREDAAPTVRHFLTEPRVAANGWVDAASWAGEYEAWRAGEGDLSGEWWWALGVEIWLRTYW
ncbi:lasso peptide isopeptide bond-forming cyclase [soil metagenome]